MTPPRTESLRSRLVRVGFEDSEAAHDHLDALAPYADPLIAPLGRAADPDAALVNLVDLAASIGAAQGAPARADFLRALADDEGTAMRVTLVLGASEGLSAHLVRHPDQWLELRDPYLGSTRPAAHHLRAALLEAVGADPADARPVATRPRAADILRVEYRRHLMRSASRDLAHEVILDDLAAELADLAAGTLEAALAIARQRVGPSHESTRLAVVAMGKCGGRELNYVSDVDVVFAAEPSPGADEAASMRVATRLASALIAVCGDHSGAGTIWPVDAALRPEGKSGPLVRTVESHRSYYDRWAKTWEFQALLKARPVAGDVAVGANYAAQVGSLAWEAADRENFVIDVQQMRRRVVDHIPAARAERELKLGVGGLRDVEFAVQLLQLVHGRGDLRLRRQATLSALWELTEGGYIGRADGAQLQDAYRFLRTVEHRLQLHQLRRAHLLPESEQDLHRLGKSLGLVKAPREEFVRQLEEARREVHRLHEKLFYRPLLEAVARIPAAQTRLSTESARDRMRALGYLDPRSALAHLERLTTGVSRRAAIQRTLLPALLGWFAEAPDPDAGLLGFRNISEALGRTPWYLSMLRDEGEVAERMAHVLASSRYATRLMEREPAGVRLLTAQNLHAQSRETLQTEMLATLARQDDRASAIGQVRAVRRRELLRIAASRISGTLDVDEVGSALTDLTLATLTAALDVAGRVVRFETGEELPTVMSVISMGRLGGHELSFGSDADVMFVHRPVPGADPERAARAAHAMASQVRALLGMAGSEPALEVDADLRPEGRQGALVRTLDSYAAYYARWSAVWEAQALLRAEAVVGDPELGADFIALIDPLRYPTGGLSVTDLAEVRRIKARVDTERLPRGADPATHLKLGRGGLADVEWTVQLLQLSHAHHVTGLRTTRTIAGLAAAAAAGLLDTTDADLLAEAWRLASRIRNAITLVRGQGSDQLPGDTRELAAVAYLLGYPLGATETFVNDYLRTTRRAKGVVDRTFWA